jgi:hypothetical protein
MRSIAMPTPSPRITRRLALAAPLALGLASRVGADAAIGTLMDMVGSGSVTRSGRQSPLRLGAGLNEGDLVTTGAETLAHLVLMTETNLNIGPDSSVMLDRYLADMGGTITIGGAMVFDRDESLGPVELTFQTEFGQIGVRGTRFFFGPSKGTAAVFVSRGRVDVSNEGVTRRLRAGDGVDMAAGQPPSAVARWGQPRIDAAFALVGLRP